MSQSQPKYPITREEIREIYQQGEDAVIALVEGLLERVSQLEARVATLENQQHRNSRNSSKPPSSDGFGKRTRSLRHKSERKSGGQPGHPGSTLEWCEEVDEIIVHAVKGECEQCGASLAAGDRVDGESRQVHDLPAMGMWVTEHQVQVKCCEGCGWLNRGQFPPEASSLTQYGEGIKGLIVYLMEGQLLPSQRVCEVLRDVLGCELSEGTLYNVREECYEQLAVVERHLKIGIEAAAVGHFDETGMRVKGQLMWLHVACTAGLTYYFPHANRGQKAMDEMDILPKFTGISVHDGLSSYAHYACDHGLCNAHHLRELLFVHERYHQGWAEEMVTLLVEIKTQVDRAKADGKCELSAHELTHFEQCYQALIEQGIEVNPSPVVDPKAPKKRGRPKQSTPKNLVDRLQVNQSAVLAFMYNFAVPFDNNQAERDLRMMKLKQKISGGFRSFAGAQRFCRIRGYLSTLKKQGVNILDALKQVFRGNPFFPSIQPE